MTEGPCPTAEEHEGDSEPQGVSQEQKSRETDDAEPARRPASPLDMLFREAEVIARNLKESGTRR